MNYRILSKIIDSQETASIKEARNLLVEKAHMSEEEADKWVRGDLRAAFPILRDKRGAKFIHGVTRLFIEQQLNNADAQNKMTRILKEVNTEENYDKFDRNLNGASLEALYGQFEAKITADDQASRDASNGKSFSKTTYQITGPFETFEEARAAWGNDSQDWCVFHMSNMFDNYTSAGQVFYVAAKNGWRDVPRKAGDDAPKDEYGNSLIAISVDMKGNLATSTPRWNHANGGGDHTYTVEELEDLLQVPFYDTFKPAKQETITWGEDGIVRVVQKKGKKFFFAGDHELSRSTFEEYFTITEAGTLKPKFKDPIVYWFEDGDFNYLKPDGTILLRAGLKWADSFHNGFARVIDRKGEWNFLKPDGTFLSKEGFDLVLDFQDGFGQVANSKGEWNYIKPDGTLLLDRWYQATTEFDANGFARVAMKNPGSWNYIDRTGNLISDIWFNEATPFKNGYAGVNLVDKGWNYIDTNGKILSKMWFDSARYFNDQGFGMVKKNGLYNLVKQDGSLLSDIWFENIYSFYSGLARVYVPDKGWNYINKDGALLLDTCYTFATDFDEDGTAQILSNTGTQIRQTINTKGQQIKDSAWKQAMGLLKKVQL